MRLEASEASRRAGKDGCGEEAAKRFGQRLWELLETTMSVFLVSNGYSIFKVKSEDAFNQVSGEAIFVVDSPILQGKRKR